MDSEETHDNEGAMIIGSVLAVVAAAAMIVFDLQPGRGSLAFEDGPPPGFEQEMASLVATLAVAAVLLVVVAFVGYTVWDLLRGENEPV